jgi:para-nitrobenzyl esterase
VRVSLGVQLYLNVYAPAASTAAAAPLPVIVYYPSGAFQWGASNDQENDAYHKAQAAGWKNVILVTVNYRTGIFGFLASPGLSARSGDNSSGLFGIHDQTMALKWVQRNIAA